MTAATKPAGDQMRSWAPCGDSAAKLTRRGLGPNTYRMIIDTGFFVVGGRMGKAA